MPKVKWSPILEMEDDNGNITSYFTEIKGEIFFITQQSDGLWAIEDWDINTLKGGLKNLTSAKRYFSRYIKS